MLTLMKKKQLHNITSMMDYHELMIYNEHDEIERTNKNDESDESDENDDNDQNE